MSTPQENRKQRTWSVARPTLRSACVVLVALLAGAAPVRDGTPPEGAPGANTSAPLRTAGVIDEAPRSVVSVDIVADERPSARSQGATGRAGGDRARQQAQVDRLLLQRVNLVLEEATIREALSALASTAGLQVAPFYGSGLDGRTIDPETVVDLQLVDVTVLDALELLLERSGPLEPATWQFRHGIIEIGPKRRLARREAREVRTYPVRDLLIETPYFKSPIAGVSLAEELGLPETQTADRRKSPSEIAAELIDLLTTSIEPGAWVPESEVREEGDWTAPIQGKRRELTLERRGRWAAVSFRDGALVVDAPGFIHRRIGGLHPSPARDRRTP